MFTAETRRALPGLESAEDKEDAEKNKNIGEKRKTKDKIHR
jgi:hypothetical protein